MTEEADVAGDQGQDAVYIFCSEVYRESIPTWVRCSEANPNSRKVPLGP